MNKKIIILILSLVIFSWVSAAVVIQKSSMIEAANSLASKWIINNHSDNPDKYNLNDNVLRQEIAAVSRWISWIQKKSKCDNIFKDLTSTIPNNWACVNVEALVDNNLISRNTNFRPEDKITKAEALWMLIKSIWFDYAYDSSNSKSWQEQLVEYSSSKWLVENFSDYNTLATRWWIFVVADTTLKNEIEIKKSMEKNRFSDEVLYELNNILSLYK